MAEYQSIRDTVVSKLETGMPELSERFGILTLRLFGSVSRKEDTPESDIDLLYSFSDEYANLDNLYNLNQHLEQLLGRKVELVPERWASERFLKSALRDACTIYPVESV